MAACATLMTQRAEARAPHALHAPHRSYYDTSERRNIHASFFLSNLIHNLSSGAQKWPNATTYGLNVEYMDRAQGATQGGSPQNLHGTRTSSAESSGRRYVAAARFSAMVLPALLGTSQRAQGPCIGDWRCASVNGIVLLSQKIRSQSSNRVSELTI